MAVEAKRGCGYRKIGGKYLVGGKLEAPCCKMPIPLHVCPACGGGIKQSMGWTWIDPLPFIAGACQTGMTYFCVLNPEMTWLTGKHGLLWIGRSFYKTPVMFQREAMAMGISRRISAVPRDFKLGKTWVFLAHSHAIVKPGAIEDEPEITPGIFAVFKPTAIEQIVTDKEAADKEFLAKLELRGITPVVVPANDKDHQGSVHDKQEDAAEPELEMA